MLERGAMIEAGDGAVYWGFEISRETIMRITAYDDRVVFGDTCETRIEVRNGALATTAPGYPCSGRQRIEQRDARVVNPDFTIYVLGRQFVADGQDGWYHVGLDRTWRSQTDILWNQLVLTTAGPVFGFRRNGNSMIQRAGRSSHFGNRSPATTSFWSTTVPATGNIASTHP